MNNEEWEKRDKIIFGRVINWDDFMDAMGGVKHFEYIDLNQINQLIEGDFIRLYQSQNDSPSTEDFIEHIKKYPNTGVHGYAVSPKRNDYRVTFEGLIRGLEEGEISIAEDEIQDFKTLCHNADSLVIKKEGLYSWWD